MDNVVFTKPEIDTLFMACAFNQARHTIGNCTAQFLSVPAKLLKPFLNSVFESTRDKAGEEQSEQAEQDPVAVQARKDLTDLIGNSKADLEWFRNKLALGVRIQSRLLSFPSGSLTQFTAEECDFLVEALRKFQEIESDNEAILVSYIADLSDKAGISEADKSLHRNKIMDERQAIQDDFVCLMAKVINYRKTLVTQPSNEQ